MKDTSKIIFCILFTLFSYTTGYSQTQKNKGYPQKNNNWDVLPGFVNPPKGYGNIPFYWWNGDTLKKERLREQLDILAASATDGFAVSYIHTSPRVDTIENKNGYGLYGMTEPGVPKVYSEDWWKIWNWFSGESAKRGLGAGIDDYTMGWTGNGFYPDELDTMSIFQGYKGELIISKETVLGGSSFNSVVPENLLAIVVWPGKIVLTDKVKNGKISWKAPKGKDYVIYTITTHTGYVIHPEHGNKLVDVYFNRFEERMDKVGRDGMNYFFQDELAYPIKILTWSDDFKEEFLKRKGYDVVPYLPALKEDIGSETTKIRLDYCEVLMDLSEERYYKPIYNWHAERGLIYGADNLSRGRNPAAYIDYFRANSWYTAPGNDAPARGSSFLETKVSSSITHMYQRPRTWLEAFHSMGWGSSGAWLTRQIDHHFIAGGNLVCMHGLYYTTHGGWWEWAPPDFHFRMPYWPHMKQWFSYTERMSYLLSQGSHVCDIAILYPTELIQAYPESKTDGVFNTALKLSNSGLDYDFVDFRSLRNAEITDQVLKIADEQYKIIILADMEAIHFSSLQKIVDFYRSGGIVLATGKLPKTSSKKGENDWEVDNILKELFGISANDINKKGLDLNVENASGNSSKQINRAGGIGWYIPLSVEKYIPEIITPDFLSENRVGKVLHRKIGERDVYMVTDVEKGSECFFRAKGKVELWDANTGKTELYPIQRQTEDGTWLRMDKESDNSYLIVFSPGEPETVKRVTEAALPQFNIPLDGVWEVELIPTLNNKWGDYRFPAFDGLIGAEARTFKYSPNLTSDINWTDPEFDDKMWKEEIYGYGPQAETKAEGISEWEPISFSWQYGVWNHPGSQGYHGLKGKVEDRFFILDKGKNQQFRTNVYAPEDGSYRIETVGVNPDFVKIDGEKREKNITLSKGWHLLETAYSGSEKVDFTLPTGHAEDRRKRSFLVLYKQETPLSEKKTLYSDEVSSRWNESDHLMYDPFGGKHREWNFRFTTAPGTENMLFSVNGEVLKIWLDGKEVDPKEISVIESNSTWNKYLVKFNSKIERIGQVALSVRSEIGYQGSAIFREPVQFKTSTGKLETGDWSKKGSLRYYSGGMLYKKTVQLPKENGDKMILHLGEVVATCEVKINGQSVGILIAPPYKVDISQFAHVDEINIEVLVYSTLSNHYQTIPTPYKGDPVAGLIGPVNISIYE